MKIPVKSAKFAQGPQINHMTKNYLSVEDKGNVGLVMTFDTELCLLRVDYKSNEPIYIPATNIAYFNGMKERSPESGSVSSKSVKSAAAS